MKYQIKAYSLQELGKRANQEDSLFPALGQSTADDRLFVLCDGMGGHEKGEVASATVCEQLSRTILSQWNPNEPLSDDLFRQALSAAYDALDAKDDGAERKMGTTLTFLCLHAEGATVAHIGDSRVYQLRPATEQVSAHIVFRTQDHSLVNDLVKIGEITEEEALHHPQKNVITRAMQPCQEQRARADIAHLTDIQPGDYFYMCSDGMLEQSTDDNILNIITKPNTTDVEKLEMLRSVTEENKDNHTAHLIHIEKVVGANPAQASVHPRSQEEPQGVLVTPDFATPPLATTPHSAAPSPSTTPRQPKRRNLLPWLLVALLLVIIAAGVSYVLLADKNETKESVKPDSVKIDSSKVRCAEKNDSGAAKKDTSLQAASSQGATSAPTPAERQSQRLDNKPIKPRESNVPINPVDQGKPQTGVDGKRNVNASERIVGEMFKKGKDTPKEEKKTSKPNEKNK